MFSQRKAHERIGAFFTTVTREKSHELLERYQDGQSDAATAVFDRYVERLLALARSRIGPKLKRRIDPEDVVQSAYRSFFVHARNKDFLIDRSGDLWRLLANITLNKLYRQIERQQAEKRTVDREEPLDVSLASGGYRDPTPAEVVALSEQFHLVIGALSTDHRLALTLRLQGQSIEEIGRAVGKSPRTIRRHLEQAQSQLEQQLAADTVAPTRNAHESPKQIPTAKAPLQYSDYVLEKLLGTGGMGKVYRARQRNSGKTVAIKTLHKSQQSDQRAVAHFVQEAQILAKLQHPNIVAVDGLGRFPGGGYFLVMDFVDGVTLASRLQTGPLPLEEAVAIVKMVAGAIAYAHDREIIHCDLKPENVLLDHSRQVVVTDFGFAQILAGNLTTTASSIGGTADYLAPEIFHLKNRPDRTTDIYALGVLLWKLATGNVPGRRWSFASAETTCAPIATICAKCLADEPPDRYQSAELLIRDLETVYFGR